MQTSRAVNVSLRSRRQAGVGMGRTDSVSRGNQRWMLMTFMLASRHPPRPLMSALPRSLNAVPRVVRGQTAPSWPAPAATPGCGECPACAPVWTSGRGGRTWASSRVTLMSGRTVSTPCRISSQTSGKRMMAWPSVWPWPPPAWSPCVAPPAAPGLTAPSSPAPAATPGWGGHQTSAPASIQVS